MKTVRTTKPSQLSRNLVLAIPLLILAACGGGGGGSSAPSTPTNLVATAVLSSAPLANCPNGGVTVEGGIDSNGNKILDPSEVTSTQYVCNGAAGANGSNGATGATGLTTLVLVTNGAAGTNCATITAGQDANANNILDAGEVTSTAYVCNGANGSNGSNGANGLNGTNGLNSLVSIVPEPAGAICTYGGSKVSSGVDSDGNTVLDATEVIASNYVCNGAPGATGSQGPAGSGITWVNVTGTTQQAAANTGYLANNDVSQVTVTLPTAPVLGDIVQVSGVGAGGWTMALNSGQSVITKDLLGNAGQDWTRLGLTGVWSSVASSADGARLVAVEAGGQIHTSTDFGLTWIARETARNWVSVASSLDGNNLVAAVSGGQIYVSSDAGISWTPRATAQLWTSVTTSGYANLLVATVSGGQIYTSQDLGVNWTARDAARNWRAVASSAVGFALVAAADDGLYTSSDLGVTWTKRLPNSSMRSVASSADGNKMVAVQTAGFIYTSTDAGVTWTQRFNLNAFNWASVASSSDGTKLVAAENSTGRLFTSIDSGLTWKFGNTSTAWSAVTTSADGSKLIAAGGGGTNALFKSNPIRTDRAYSLIHGAQYDSLDLQYVGGGTFIVRGHAGMFVMQ